MMPERRGHLRRRHLRKGKVVFRKGCGVMDCVVLDMHESGAKLQLADWMNVPDRIELRIENGSSHQAEVRYRKMETVGVQFIGDRTA
jgi:hypothetical protein